MLTRSVAGAEPASGPRPNIVVILADDMGYSDLGCYGSEIQTPHIDGLARDGVRFSQFYCAARCCPSRASLLTGLYPHQAGMGGMVSRPEKPGPKGPYQGYLNDRCATIAEVLGRDGYRTYMSGKWHVGEAPEHWPRKRGFDRYFGLISGASSYWEILKKPGRMRVMALDDERYTPGDGFYMTDATTDFAVECLRGHDESHGGQPFFLYLPYTAPHWPLHAWPEDIAKYRGKYRGGWDALRRQRYKRLVALGLIDEKWPLSPRDSEVPPWDEAENHEDWDLRMAVYAAMIDRMDQGIGRVLDTIRKMGAEDNTLVLFMSDNGGCHESVEKRRLHTPGKAIGERGSYVAYKRPWANASNTPFRLFKHWVHEGGIATPLIARWPNVIRERGTITHQPGHIVDIMATCLDITGAPYPSDPVLPCEGKSLLPVFRGETREPHDALYWEHMGNRAIRKGKWKLVAVKRGEWELYDLEADRTELNDLSGAHPEKAEELFDLYDAWAKRTGVERKKTY
ncbi:MAG: sulfatase-like hydrolase/transferase [Nitrospiraceae bacterium]|nr:sulfatase-like hydrolase/transferase [Nitrospiraceae bacterium]